MAYKDLSLAERHAIIRESVARGIHRLSDIEAMYDASYVAPEQQITVVPTEVVPQTDVVNTQANIFSEGGNIRIAPSKKGTFTAAATKHGKSVQAFASQVLAHKENYSPAMVKKAVFAHNSKSWKHSTGGPLYPFSFSKDPLPAVRYADGGQKVDIDAWYAGNNNRNRGVNVEHLKQFQDSLIANDIKLPQRLSLLGTSAQETGSKGAASYGIGGMGLLGLSGQRMDSALVSNHPDTIGQQIHFLIQDLKSTHPDNWADGGSGGIKIRTGKEGFNKFWNTNDVDSATQILNKSYIRPAEREAAWNNRAKVAKSMMNYLTISPK